jgi:uncharacterized protein
MTPQERELTVSFLQQLTQAQAGRKDSEADALIREACARQPEADYLLVQRAIALDVALQATQAQVAKLQAQLDQAQPDAKGGFLDAPNAWGRSASASGAAQRPSAQAAASSAPATSSPAPGRAAAQAPAAPPAQASSWGSGMLGNIATTAAGVVAGSFLFQGIQGLMGHHNQGLNSLSDSVQPEHDVVGDHERGIDHQQVADNADDLDTPDDSDYSDFDDSSLGDTDSV